MSNEWYTPTKYVEAAREVMGGIDLDPASSEIANKTVKATRYYTEHDNGLLQNWYGRVFCNPPYSRTPEMRGKHQSYIAMFSKKLLSHYAAGDVTQAILLASAQVDAKWFQPLWQFSICMVGHKIHFNMPEQKKSYSFHMFGTCFVYLGPNEARFTEVFSKFGRIVRAIDTPAPRPVARELWESEVACD